MKFFERFEKHFYERVLNLPSVVQKLELISVHFNYIPSSKFMHQTTASSKVFLPKREREIFSEKKVVGFSIEQPT